MTIASPLNRTAILSKYLFQFCVFVLLLSTLSFSLLKSFTLFLSHKELYYSYIRTVLYAIEVTARWIIEDINLEISSLRER